MPLVRDVMTRRPVSVSPDDTVRAAMELLRNEQLDVIPVLRDGELVGSVSALGLFCLYGEMPLSEALDAPLPAIEPDVPVGVAAVRMAKQGTRVLAVTEGSRLAGLLTERDLAACWGSVPDPLTGLPWQDEMRRWAASSLAHGREIAILFLDLNGFGPFNKDQGHVLGDRALQTVALALRGAIDPELDRLCRYGGDEFVVATTRSLLQARSLAIALRRVVAEARIPGEEVSLSVAIGIAGGQRSGQRPGAHAPATLDDLINLASRASTHAKETAEQCYAIQGAGENAPWRGEPLGSDVRTRLEGYQVTHDGGDVSAIVTLRRVTEARSGSAMRPADEMRFAVAIATAASLASYLPDDFELVVQEVAACATGVEGEVIGAAVALRIPGGGEERLFGAAPALPDTSRSVINAVLDATNRRLGYWLARGALEENSLKDAVGGKE